jgi:lysophospholipase L1-like esterase
MSRGSILRRAIARIVLLSVSAALALVAAEVAVRIVKPQPVLLVDRGLYAADSPSGYRLQPGFRGRISNRVEFDTQIAVNRDGLRGPEIGPKRPGRLRVLVLGDSFAFGVGVEEAQSYPRRLEALLRGRGIDAEVLNAGVPGYGLGEEADWFERHGRQLEPDFVIVTSFLGNDFQDAAPGQPKAEVVDGALQVVGERSSPLSRALYYHSHLYVALKTSGFGGRLRRLLGRPSPLDARHLESELDLYRKRAEGAFDSTGAAEIDAACARLTQAVGETPTLLVLVPSLLQVDPAEWSKALAAFRAEPARYDPRQPNEWFAETSRWGDSVPIVDVAPRFAAAIRGGAKVYLPIDKHLTPAGYALLAEEVAKRVEELTRPGAYRLWKALRALS